MRPFPADLVIAYPAFPGSLPARPWWRRQLSRSGVPILERASDLHSFVDKGASDDADWCLRRAASEDEAAPLPHPGIRVGQVWATRASTRVAGDPVITVLAADGGRWLIGHEWVHHFVLQGVLRDAFLVVDPACPWLAPWSPSSMKTPVLTVAAAVSEKSEKGLA